MQFLCHFEGFRLAVLWTTWLSIFVLFTGKLAAQQTDTSSENRLGEVVVKAFGQDRKLRDLPAAVNAVRKRGFERFSPASVVQAVNALPGVRMEERSPGSYRFNIRGSALRSPFGVRNVKVYFNDLPITDPGGHTYLNQLGYYNFASLEIIKGPGSSLYGGGTGGVLLIESLTGNEQPGAFVEAAGGSYGLRNVYLSVTSGSKGMVSRAGFQHQESNGYRQQSALKRDVHSWTGQFHFGENRFLKTSFLYGDLFYETPGALTRSEWEADPRKARPGGGGFPGSVEAHASIRQRSFLAGASYEQGLAARWTNRSVLYGMFTELRNPTLRNYGKNSEPHVGGRTDFRYLASGKTIRFQWDGGAEWQTGFTTASIFQNRNGNPDTLQTTDDIRNRQSFLFSQVTLDGFGFTLMGGASYNWLRVRFQRFAPASGGVQHRDFTNGLAPRLALLRKLGKVNLYSSVSKGFSPPTTAELLPTGGAINLSLDAEKGLNSDLGVRGNLGPVSFDVNGFLFRLRNTIVQRRDAGGGDFFINAGRTVQKGLETLITLPRLFSYSLFPYQEFWISHTWHHFRYKDFKQGNSDYSGNPLPGVAPHTISTGIDLQAKNGLLATISYYYSDRVPLNDAHTESAPAYHLLGGKLGYERWLGKTWRVKLVAGGDNLLDQRYSLGPDINGFGGRYYNAAPGRNYYASLLLQWVAHKGLLGASGSL